MHIYRNMEGKIPNVYSGYFWFDNYLDFSICPRYTALLVINKSLYVSLDAYKILCFHFC